MTVELVADSLPLGDIHSLLSGPERGAVVIFLGCVRATEEGRPITAIRYEAYEAMARRVLETAAREAGEQHAAEVLVRHRTGRVPVGEPSLVVAAAAAHRAEAFEAACAAVEAIKRDAPIWKVEFR